MSALAKDRIDIQSSSDAAVTRFAVIGERCSGTNYAAHCINLNLPLKAAAWEDYGWKHGFPGRAAYPDETLFVVMLRDPVSWAKSLYAKPWHARFQLMNKDFSTFLRTRWDSRIHPAKAFQLPDDTSLEGKVLQWDRHPVTGRPYDNLLKLRNDKTAGFLGMKQRAANVVLLRMDLLVDDPDQVIGRIAERFALAPRDLELETTSRQMGRLQRPVPAPEPPPDTPNQEDLDFISSQLDLKQEETMGFVAPFA